MPFILTWMCSGMPNTVNQIHYLSTIRKQLMPMKFTEIHFEGKKKWTHEINGHLTFWPCPAPLFWNYYLIFLTCFLLGAFELITDESKAGSCLWITNRRGMEYWPTSEEEAKYSQVPSNLNVVRAPESFEKLWATSNFCTLSVAGDGNLTIISGNI